MLHRDPFSLKDGVFPLLLLKFSPGCYDSEHAHWWPCGHPQLLNCWSDSDWVPESIKQVYNTTVSSMCNLTGRITQKAEPMNIGADLQRPLPQ